MLLLRLTPRTFGIWVSNQMVIREEGADFVPGRINTSKGEMRCYKGKEKNKYVQNIRHHIKTSMRRGTAEGKSKS